MKKTSEFDQNHPVAKAVEPLRAEAIARAEQEAQKLIDRTKQELEAAGFDREKVAPFPSSGDPGYRQKISKFHLVSFLTVSLNAVRLPKEPCPVRMDSERCDRFIARSKEEASASYSAFIAKLIGKIGACQSATLSGSHVWSFSTLTVVKCGGFIEQWNTQQIINVSKFGKLFNQWPSRKIGKRS